jgi:hypothetical protein
MRGQTIRLALTAGLWGCGGSGTAPPPPPAPVTFSGTYGTRVTLVQSACGAVTVQDNPTVVTHDPSSGAVSFGHAGQTYPGTVASSGAFTTTPRVLDVHDGFIYTIGIAGQFAATGFEAEVTVDRAGPGSVVCRYLVHWTGARTGG